MILVKCVHDHILRNGSLNNSVDERRKMSQLNIDYQVSQIVCSGMSYLATGRGIEGDVATGIDTGTCTEAATCIEVVTCMGIGIGVSLSSEQKLSSSSVSDASSDYSSMTECCNGFYTYFSAFLINSSNISIYFRVCFSMSYNALFFSSIFYEFTFYFAYPPTFLVLSIIFLRLWSRFCSFIFFYSCYCFFLRFSSLIRRSYSAAFS